MCGVASGRSSSLRATTSKRCNELCGMVLFALCMRRARAAGVLSPRPALGAEPRDGGETDSTKCWGVAPSRRAEPASQHEQRMFVEAVVVAQLLEHRRWQRDGAVFVAFARADAQLVLAADDVMHGELQALRQPQATAVDELERRAVTAQADVLQ